MPSTFFNRPLLWTCLALLFTVFMSCENSGDKGDAIEPDGTDPKGDDTTQTDKEGDGNEDEQEQDKEYCGTLGANADTSKEQFANQMCCLCKDCEFTPEERFYTYVDSNQTTCSGIEFDMFNVEPRSETCFETQRKYRETCCNTECKPRPVDQEWEPVEPVFPQGDYPSCHLCKNGQYPLLPYTITAIAYVPGNPTCADLYWMGRTNNIPGAMCYPIQNFMEEPCGCLPPGPEERPQGDEPLCDICHGGQYPLRPGGMPNEVDAPVNTNCEDLYWMGRTGNISAKLCEQVREKAQDACGCLPTE